MKLLVGSEVLLARLTGAYDRAYGNLRKAVRRLAIKVQGTVKTDKLTGQVLHVRTGTLRRSINQQVTETPDGIFAKVGTNLRYAGIHERGGKTSPHVIEPVRARVLRFLVGGVPVFARRVNHPGSVMPKRSFLVSTLEEMTPEINTSLRVAVLAGLKGGAA